VDARDQVAAAHHLHRRAREPDVEAGISREHDLVAGLDAAGL
jgi:hypothetical protein